MTWGGPSYGIQAWGNSFGLAVDPTLDSRAYSDRSVLVQLSHPPLQASEAGDGDALNPSTWFVESAGEALTVLAVVPHSTTVFEVRTLQLLDSYLFDIEVGANAMRIPSGAVDPPFSFTTPGCKAKSRVAGAASAYVDVANPPFVGLEPGGQLVVGSSGDYRNETGGPLIKKLIVRMLTTLPGEFFAAADFGIGIQLKAPLIGSDLTVMRTQIESQALKLPDVEGVAVRLTFASSILTVEVKVRVRQQGDVSETLQVPLAGAEF